jgi:hypothetical protein
MRELRPHQEIIWQPLCLRGLGGGARHGPVIGRQCWKLAQKGDWIELTTPGA